MKYHYEGINISMTKQGQTKGSRKKVFLSSRKKIPSTGTKRKGRRKERERYNSRRILYIQEVCPFSYGNSLCEIGHDFLDIKYIFFDKQYC